MQGPLKVTALLIPKKQSAQRLVNDSHRRHFVLTVRCISQIVDEPHLVIISIGAKATPLEAIQALLELQSFLGCVVSVVAYNISLMRPCKCLICRRAAIDTHGGARRVGRYS